MSLFKRLTKQEAALASKEEEMSEQEVQLGELEIDEGRRQELMKHLEGSADEYWCQACNLYFSEEKEVQAHMETDEHKKTEEVWRQDNPEDLYPQERHRNSKPSRKLLKMRASKKRKELIKKGLLPEAKTGHSRIAETKTEHKFSSASYHAAMRKRAAILGRKRQ